MATGADQAAGYGMVATAGAIFTYYTLWVIILPFVEEDSDIHQYFLPRVYALLIPIVAGLLALAGLATLIGVTLLRSRTTKLKTS